MSEQKPRNPMASAVAVKNLKAKVTEASRELEKERTAVEEIRNLPVVQQGLQARIRSLASELYLLQRGLDALNEASVANEMIEVLGKDLDSLRQTKAPSDDKKIVN